MGVFSRFRVLSSRTPNRVLSSRTPNRDSEEYLAQLQRRKFGSFTLPDCIGIAGPDCQIPTEGYRVGEHIDDETGVRTPVIVAAVSKEKLFDTFMALLAPLPDVLTAVVEADHDRRRPMFEYWVDAIDNPVLRSYLFEFEEHILADGCIAIAVIDMATPCEVQFDSHKLLYVYGKDLAPFRAILDDLGIPENENLRTVADGEHAHSSSDEHEQICTRFVETIGAEVQSEADARYTDDDRDQWSPA